MGRFKSAAPSGVHHCVLHRDANELCSIAVLSTASHAGCTPWSIVFSRCLHAGRKAVKQMHGEGQKAKLQQRTIHEGLVKKLDSQAMNSVRLRF